MSFKVFSWAFNAPNAWVNRSPHRCPPCSAMLASSELYTSAVVTVGSKIPLLDQAPLIRFGYFWRDRTASVPPHPAPQTYTCALAGAPRWRRDARIREAMSDKTCSMVRKERLSQVKFLWVEHCFKWEYTFKFKRYLLSRNIRAEVPDIWSNQGSTQLLGKVVNKPSFQPLSCVLVEVADVVKNGSAKVVVRIVQLVLLKKKTFNSCNTN